MLVNYNAYVVAFELEWWGRGQILLWKMPDFCPIFLLNDTDQKAPTYFLCCVLPKAARLNISSDAVKNNGYFVINWFHISYAL